MSQEDYFSELLWASVRRLSSGLDLEFVSLDGSDWIELGGHRVDYEIIEIEQSELRVIALQSYVTTLDNSIENLKRVATFRKWFVTPQAHYISREKFDFVVAAEVVISGKVEFDSEVFATQLESLVIAKIDFAKAP